MQGTLQVHVAKDNSILRDEGVRGVGGGGGLLYNSVARYVNMENMVSVGGFMLCSVFLFFGGGGVIWLGIFGGGGY